MADIDIDVDDLKRRMDGAVSVLRQEFAGLRTGRASIAILDPVTVPAYGSQLPVNQCATINVPDPRMITVNVWDRSLVSAVDKAIRDSGLGLNPVVDGTILRLPIPELNEERRGETRACRRKVRGRRPNCCTKTFVATEWTRSRQQSPKAWVKTTSGFGPTRYRS